MRRDNSPCECVLAQDLTGFPVTSKYSILKSLIALFTFRRHTRVFDIVDAEVHQHVVMRYDAFNRITQTTHSERLLRKITCVKGYMRKRVKVVASIDTLDVLLYKCQAATKKAIIKRSS